MFTEGVKVVYEVTDGSAWAAGRSMLACDRASPHSFVETVK
jgi:hypothetical protein